MKLTIPQIRERLHELSVYHGIGELASLAEATRRKPPSRPRAPAQSKNPSPAVQQAIRDYATRYPNDTLAHIGYVFGVNQGRVSEALAQ